MRRKQFKHAMGRMGGAANLLVKAKHHALVKNERWIGDIVFKNSWDVDDLCDDVKAPTCGLTELHLSGNNLGNAGELKCPVASLRDPSLPRGYACIALRHRWSPRRRMFRVA